LCAFSLKISDLRRVIAFGFGLAGTLGWLVLLRHSTHFFWISPALPWSFCIATVIFSLFFERRLRQSDVAPALETPVPSPALPSTS